MILTKINEIKYYSYFDCILGLLQVCCKNDKIIEIKLVNEISQERKLTKILDIVCKQLDEYFSRKRKQFDFPISLEGSNFQKNVLENSLKIPYGEITSYKDIAIKIGKPKAYRAVGSSLNKNKIIVVVPCHRIIGSSNKLVGYAYGLDIKKKLLELENPNYFI